MTTTSATPQRLYLVQLAAATVPLPNGQTLDMSAGCYLVQTSDGKNILIDSGFPANHPSPPGTPPFERGKNVIEHLAELGLLTIDAVALQRLFTPDRNASPIDDNEEELRASTRKLLDIVERDHVTLVIFGHDGQQWRTLKKAPDYYD